MPHASTPFGRTSSAGRGASTGGAAPARRDSASGSGRPRQARRPVTAGGRPGGERPGGERPGGDRLVSGLRRPTQPSSRTASTSTKPPKVTSTAASRSALDAALAEAVRVPVREQSFEELGVPAVLVEALRRRGVTDPFAIQVRTLPDALAGRDVLGRAATGGGKTLAYGLAILARLAGAPAAQAPVAPDAVAPRGRRGRTSGAPRALVLVPSRELALQVTDNLAPLAAVLGLRVTTIVGGAGYGRQIDALTSGVDLVVATPGRLIDLIERQDCRLDQVEIVAVDEADYMADLGFLPVVVRLLRMTPPEGQRLLFSATLDHGVAGLVETFLNRPAIHAVAPATASIAAMTHRVFMVHRDDKVQVAAEVAVRPARTLFFVRTKHGADRLARQLERAGVEAAALHGNLAQNARQRVVAAFADGRTRVLVATDVAARGLHVDDVDLVVHYDPPADHKAYLHRSGRTARAGNEGTVVSFVQSDQMSEVRRLHREAAIEALVESVAPGHQAVQAMGASGEPILVRAAPPRTSAPSAGRGRRRPGTGAPSARRAG